MPLSIEQCALKTPHSTAADTPGPLRDCGSSRRWLIVTQQHASTSPSRREIGVLHSRHRGSNMRRGCGNVAVPMEYGYARREKVKALRLVRRGAQGPGVSFPTEGASPGQCFCLPCTVHALVTNTPRSGYQDCSPNTHRGEWVELGPGSLSCLVGISPRSLLCSPIQLTPNSHGPGCPESQVFLERVENPCERAETGSDVEASQFRTRMASTMEIQT